MVFKIYRQDVEYWDDLFIPWVHYVPVADDFSDIQEMYAWCEANQEKCENMIRNAKQLFQTIYMHENVLKYVNSLLDHLMDEQSGSR